MKALSIGILIALVGTFVSLAPAATAATCAGGGVAVACVYDDSAGFGDNCTYDGVRVGYTGAEVYTAAGGAYAVGQSYCDTWIPMCYEYEENAIFVGGYTNAAGGAQVGWYNYDFQSPCWGNFSGCGTYVLVYSVTFLYRDIGCPAGNPPNPGWGNVLP
ncbi:MAG TPA: hypothetical protein VFH78_12130 [Candidatus Thermoplasmatota archaeon]|nr:hypothetical protein [Candidatus Thermoplasmatota archaeon]